MLAMNQAGKAAKKELSVQSQNGQKLSSLLMGDREPAAKRGFQGCVQGLQSLNEVLL